jgi:hypothetical protein
MTMPKMALQIEYYTDEADIWRDAWRIADPGAVNPVAVARTLFKASAFLMHKVEDTASVKKHPALRLIAAQLASLYNVDSDGGSCYDALFINIVGHVNESLDFGDELNAAITKAEDAIKEEFGS